MAATRPSSDQIRFLSAANGEQNLDTYMEAVEKGGRTLGDLMAEFFDNAGDMTNFVEFRENPSSPGDLQWRNGSYIDPNAGWQAMSFTDFTQFVTDTSNNAAAALASQNAAATSESNAATSESNAATSASNASTSETNAASSASTASTQAGIATTQASNAASSASSASTSASTATTQASNASTSATTATTQAGIATTQATNASNSASAASTSETNAATSASNASTSESNADTARIAAQAAQSAAETAQTNTQNIFDAFGDQYAGPFANDAAAETALGAALGVGDLYWNTTDNELRWYNGATWSAPSALANASASAAATSESNAATSESNAATSESNAATSASNAATSESNAATSATNAANSYDAFDDRYLGSKASEPTLDNDGQALLTGALYWSTASQAMFVYDGAAWQTAASSIPGQRSEYVYTASNAQTVFTGSDDNANTLTIESATLVDVYKNGLRLAYISDYTVDAGTDTVTLTSGASNNDQIVIVAYGNIAAPAPGNYTTLEADTYIETVNNQSGTSFTLDCNVANVFTISPSGNPTFTITNPAASGKASSLTVIFTPSAEITAITWPANTKWQEGSAPSAAASGSTQVYSLITTDAGTTWLGFIAGSNMA